MFPAVPLAEQIAGLSDHLSRWTAAGATILVHLFKNNFTPTPASVLADYTEMTSGDFPGYASIPITGTGTPFINAQGNAEQVFSDPVFQPASDPPTPITVYGYFVTMHPTIGSDSLIYGVRFDAPLTISLATQAVPIDPDISQVAFSSPASQ